MRIKYYIDRHMLYEIVVILICNTIRTTTNNNRYMNINITQTIFHISYENDFHVMCI